MKLLSALVLSLLLLWGQVFVAAQRVPPDAPAKCTCCDCNQTNCCVQERSADSSPLPVATVQIGSQHLPSFSPPAAIAWMLPRDAVVFSSADLSSSLSATRVPLFHRDCALLI